MEGFGELGPEGIAEGSQSSFRGVSSWQGAGWEHTGTGPRGFLAYGLAIADEDTEAFAGEFESGRQAGDSGADDEDVELTLCHGVVGG